MLQGKCGLVLGVANKRSIAWAIAEAASRAGARIAFNYQTERLKENVEELAGRLPNSVVLPCDVQKDEEIEALFCGAKDALGGLDFLVHSLAFAKREELDGEFLKVTRDGFKLAQEISAYSLAAVAKAALPLMEGRAGSIVTMTYLGSERVVPNYNVMGVAKASLEATVRYLANDLGPKNIRVNAISAGPLRTLAASGVSGFSSMLETYPQRAPLRRNIEASEVADAAVFLLSPLARGITGEVIHVDAGYHILGM